MPLVDLPAAALADVQQLPLFVIAGLLLNLTPGVDMALVLRSTGAQGFRGGAAAALGVGAGCWVHTLAAALGLTALLASSPQAFDLLRLAGAAWLVWLGLGLLRAPPAAAGAAAPSAGRRLFVQGFLTNALNPKVALFFLAFLPQFIRPGAQHPVLAGLLLGALFVVNGTLVCLAIAALAAGLRARLAGRPGVARLGLWLQRATGGLCVWMGLKLLVQGVPR